MAVGTSYQKENVKHLFLADNALTELPLDPKDFAELNWLTLSKYFIIKVEMYLHPLKDLTDSSA